MLRSGARVVQHGATYRIHAHPHIQVRWNAQVARSRVRFPGKTSNVIPIEELFEVKGKAKSAPDSKTKPKQRSRATNSDSKKKRRITPTPKKSVKHVLYNKGHIKSIYEVPTASQLGISFDPVADFPRLINESGLSAERLHCGRLPLKKHGGQVIEVATLRIMLEDGSSLQVQGHGATPEEAMEAVNLHAVCQLHKSGDLSKIIIGASEYIDPGASELRREADAKKDIINYAARHDCLPIFSFHKMRRVTRSLYRAHASIPALGLDGYGKGTTIQNAMLKASISLKDAAEARHRLTGEGTLLVKDYTRLTTDSSEKFVYFYCNHQRIECSVNMIEKKENKTGGTWAANVILKCASIQNDRKDISLPKHGWKLFSDGDAWPGASRGDKDMKWKFEGLPMATRVDAESVGYLVAALALKKESPYLWENFAKEMKRGNGDILKDVYPIDFHIGRNTVDIMKETLQKAAAVEDDTVFSPNKFDVPTERKFRNYRQLTKREIENKNEQLKRRLEFYDTIPSLAEMRHMRLKLPMSQYRDQVMKMIHQNHVCVIVGATGSGKTTQVPQLILDDLIRDGKGGSCNIICTQPRRIAAISVAERVAVERNEQLRESVGYSVRFNSKPPNFGGSIHYCTAGVVLKQIQESQAETLEGISHIIIDEVHERDLNNDFLLVVLKNLMQERKAAGKPAIKIILMSATIEPSLFCKYFGDGYPDNMCPHIKVPGKTFPVTSHFLDDICSDLRHTYSKDMAMDLYSKESDLYISRELEGFQKSRLPATADLEDFGSNDNKAFIDWRSKGLVGEDGELDVIIDRQDTLTPVGLMAVTIAHLLKTTTEGSILVFLPGLQEIVALEKILKNTRPLGIDFVSNPDCRVYVLHSSLPQMQQDVFAKVGPGQRKIILATNIAETSVTIPDVVYVVDSSKQREIQYDETRRISSLVSTWTARSNAQQRAGRAGRVQHGHYYTMASKARYESFEIASKPEILRTDLQSLCLQIKSMGIKDVWGFLRMAIDPPSQSAVETAIDELQALSALDDGSLTPLGRYLSVLPVAPSIGKMVVLAAIFRCLDPILIMAAMSTTKSPFLTPPGKKKDADWYRAKWAQGTNSDHAAVINAFQEWRRLRRSGRGSWQPDREFAWANFLHHDTLCQIARTADQILTIMQSSGLVDTPLQAKAINGMPIQYGSSSENMYSKSEAVQIAMATAGFFPNIAVRNKGTLPRFLRTVHENEATINPYSQAAPRRSDGQVYGKISERNAPPFGTLFTFAEKTQHDGNGIELRSVARTYPLAVFLFGGRSSRRGEVLTVDEWIPFSVQGRAAIYLLQRLRYALQRFLERTLSRLAVPKGNRPKINVRFLDQDKVRGPLVNGIAEALELCAPKRPLTLRPPRETTRFNEDSKERPNAELPWDFHSSSPSGRPVELVHTWDTLPLTREQSKAETFQHFYSLSGSERSVESVHVQDRVPFTNDRDIFGAVEPVNTVEPVEPVKPIKPIKPVKPFKPVKPVKPGAQILSAFSSKWQIRGSVQSQSTRSPRRKEEVQGA